MAFPYQLIAGLGGLGQGIATSQQQQLQNAYQSLINQQLTNQIAALPNAFKTMAAAQTPQQLGMPSYSQQPMAQPQFGTGMGGGGYGGGYPMGPQQQTPPPTQQQTPITPSPLSLPPPTYATGGGIFGTAQQTPMTQTAQQTPVQAPQQAPQMAYNYGGAAGVPGMAGTPAGPAYDPSKAPVLPTSTAAQQPSGYGGGMGPMFPATAGGTPGMQAGLSGLLQVAQNLQQQPYTSQGFGTPAPPEGANVFMGLSTLSPYSGQAAQQPSQMPQQAQPGATPYDRAVIASGQTPTMSGAAAPSDYAAMPQQTGPGPAPQQPDYSAVGTIDPQSGQYITRDDVDRATGNAQARAISAGSPELAASRGQVPIRGTGGYAGGGGGAYAPSPGGPPLDPSTFGAGRGGAYAPSPGGQTPTTALFNNVIVPLESGWNMDTSTVGSYGEIGPAQITPDTWREYSLPGENIRDPQTNLAVGHRVTEDLWRKSGGDAAAVLVGYNRGEGAMKRFQQAGDDLGALKGSMMPTRAYQARIQQVLNSPEAMYQRVRGALNMTTDPSDQQAGQFGARAALRAMPNPLMLSGRFDIGTLARFIDNTNPNLNDTQKMMVFKELYPMLSEQAKTDFNQRFEIYKTQSGIVEKQYEWAQKDEEFQIRQQELAENRAERLQLGYAQLGGKNWDLYTVPSGPEAGKTYRVNKSTGEFEPLQTPAGLTKLGTKAPGGDKPYTDAQAKYYANWMARGLPLPTGTGRSKAGMEQINAALADMGLDPGKVAQSQATFKADSHSLMVAQTQSDNAARFELTAMANLKTATEALHGVSPNMGPWLNEWIQKGEQLIGDPRVPAETMAVLTFANEYAKVMTGATTGAGVTEGARRDAWDHFSPYFSSGQWDAVSEIAKRDMGNRLRENTAYVDWMRTQIGRGTGPREGEPDPSLAAPPTGAGGRPGASAGAEKPPDTRPSPPIAGQDEGGGDPDSIPLPKGTENDPEGTGYDGPEGKPGVWVKRGDRLVRTPGAVATGQ